MITNIVILCGVAVIILPTALGQFEDKRCKCLCPSPNLLYHDKNLTDRNLWIKMTGDRADCKCLLFDAIVSSVPSSDLTAFCSKCDCQFQYRNTTTIKVVVILVICVIGLLVVYLLFLLCLDPMLKQPRKEHPYERQENDEDNIFARSEVRSSTFGPPQPADTRLRRTSEAVLSKVEQQQNKWFAKVHEQRRKIFTDHTMLN